MNLWRNFIEFLNQQYGSNRIVSWWEFDRNIVKYNIDENISTFDKPWSNFLNGQYGSTLIILDSHLSKIFQIAKKELLIETYVESDSKYDSNMIQTALCLDLSLLYVFLINIDQCFLKARYGSNRVVCDLNFLKIFEIEEKYDTLIKTWKNSGKGTMGQTVLSLI